jgi:3-phenylpropionate/trans-cinnamate dioxygenase ferredoxin subunit
MTIYGDVVELPDLAGRHWSRACPAGAVPEDEGVRLETVPPVSVFTSEGEFFCIDDTCTHEDYSLAEGWVEGCVVECTLHMARFSLRSGEVLGPPATAPVKVHPVALVAGELYAALPTAYVLPGRPE